MLTPSTLRPRKDGPEREEEELEREENRASILFKIKLRMGSVGRGASDRIGHFFVKPPTW